MTSGAARRGLLAATLVLSACGSASNDSSNTASTNASDDRLPDVEIVSLADSSTSSLAEADGPTVVNLWATWCGPCRREIPEFEQVYRERGDDVTFVGINIGEGADDAAAFIAEVGATYPQYLDPDGYVATELKATTMPMTVVTDARGVIVSRHLGEMSASELEAAIDDASG